MANARPAVGDRELAALSRELKVLIDHAQRIRDQINRHLNVAGRRSIGIRPAAPPRPRAGTRGNG